MICLPRCAERAEKPAVFGDCAYADGENARAPGRPGVRGDGQGAPAGHGRDGLFAKDDFVIDLDAGTVGLPGRPDAPSACVADGGGLASFGPACATCPLAGRCTTDSLGARTSASTATSSSCRDHKAAQADPRMAAGLQGHPAKGGAKDRPLRPPGWGGRKARARRQATDRPPTSTPGPPALNWSRLNVLGVHWDGATWAAAGP